MSGPKIAILVTCICLAPVVLFLAVPAAIFVFGLLLGWFSPDPY